MTCIVGIYRNVQVAMGGDSAGVDTGTYGLSVRSDPKVFRNGEFLMGFTTSFRMGQLLRFSFTPPTQKENQDLYAYMCTDFIDSVRKCFIAGGWATVDKQNEKGGVFLVGCRGRLFRIEEDYQVGEAAAQFDACGCGQDYAIGAVSALWGSSLSNHELISKALETAHMFSAGVRPPFVIEELPNA